MRVLSLLITLLFSAIMAFGQGQSTDLLNQAKFHYKSGDYSKSYEIAERILQENNSNFDALLLKADCHQKKDEFEQAIVFYKKANGIDKASALLYTNWGAALINLKKYDAAEKKLKQAFQLDENLASTHYFMGNVAYFNFNINAAIKYYDKAIELDPNYRDALYMRAASHAEKEEVALALADYEAVHRLDPSLNEVSFNLAVINIDNENFDEALKLLEEIEPTAIPREMDYYFYKAEALYYSGEKDEACKLYKQAADIGDTESADIHHRFCLKREERSKKREKTTIRASF